MLFVLIAVDLSLGWAFNPRSIRSPHGYYHHTLDPSASNIETFGGKRTRYFTNSLGMRDRESRRVPLKSDRRRLLILGDSFAEGVGFRFPRTAIGQLAAALPEVDVLNAAVVSFSPLLSRFRLEYLIDEIGLEVDEVVLFVDISDPQDEFLYQGFEPHEIPRARLLTWRAARVLRRGSYLAAQVARWRRDPKAAAWFDEGVFVELQENFEASRAPDFWALRGNWPALEGRSPAWLERGLALQRANLERIIWYCEERDLPLTIVAYPWPQQLGREWLEGVHIDPIRSLASRYRVPLVDLYPVFAALGDRPTVREEYFLPRDMHWNRRGNTVVAQELIRALGPGGPASR